MGTRALSRRSAIALLAILWLACVGSGAAAPPSTAGLPHGVTPDGHYYLGRADAPVTMVEYGDFL